MALIKIKKNQSWKKFGPKAVILSIAMVSGITYSAARYKIGFDNQEIKCLPDSSVFLIDTFDKEVVRNNLYMFASQGMEPFFKEGEHIIKIARGVPGDLVEVTGEVTKINGITRGEGLHLAKKLKVPESNFYGKGTLAENENWFMGTSFQSFDSRYWGKVKSNKILGRAYAIF